MGQILFLRKIQLLVQITWYGHETIHSFYINPNLTRALLKGAVSIFFFFFFFFFQHWLTFVLLRYFW